MESKWWGKRYCCNIYTMLFYSDCIWIFSMTIFLLALLQLSTFAIHKPFKCAKSLSLSWFLTSRNHVFHCFWEKCNWRPFGVFFGRKEKDASSEQILKNLLGRDHSGFLFTFFFSWRKTSCSCEETQFIMCFPELLVYVK